MKLKSATRNLFFSSSFYLFNLSPHGQQSFLLFSKTTLYQFLLNQQIKEGLTVPFKIGSLINIDQMCLKKLIGERIKPSPGRSTCYLSIIKAILLLHLAALALNAYLISQFLQQFIGAVLMLVGLLITIYRCSYKALMLIQLISIYCVVLYLAHIFLIVQHGQKVQSMEYRDRLAFFAACTCSFYYLCWSIFCFFPYRQFKSQFFAELAKLEEQQNQQQSSKNITEEKLNTDSEPRTPATGKKIPASVLRRYLHMT